MPLVCTRPEVFTTANASAAGGSSPAAEADDAKPAAAMPLAAIAAVTTSAIARRTLCALPIELPPSSCPTVTVSGG